MNSCASPARSKEKDSATTGSSSPLSRSAISGAVRRSSEPSRSHQLSMSRPKTPLFSFIIDRLFHHGIVARGIESKPFSAAGMLRPLSFEASERPNMTSRPPARSRR